MPIMSAHLSPGIGWLERLGQVVRPWRPLLHGCAASFALIFSRPTDLTNAAALAIVLTGAALRIWASRHLCKDQELCTSGPYAYIRHPLYAANFIIMVGLCIAANNLLVTAIALPIMVVVYAGVIAAEERKLRARFGSAYEEYASRVPALLPLRGLRGSRERSASVPVAWVPLLARAASLVILVGLFELKEDLLERCAHIAYPAVWGLAVPPACKLLSP
jgi:protein-S-isoprenylcysteine O-methyltransferase Ste14